MLDSPMFFRVGV